VVSRGNELADAVGYGLGAPVLGIIELKVKGSLRLYPIVVHWSCIHRSRHSLMHVSLTLTCISLLLASNNDGAVSGGLIIYATIQRRFFLRLLFLLFLFLDDLMVHLYSQRAEVEVQIAHSHGVLDLGCGDALRRSTDLGQGEIVLSFIKLSILVGFGCYLNLLLLVLRL
jgi:hypothetical protein